MRVIIQRRTYIVQVRPGRVVLVEVRPAGPDKTSRWRPSVN